MRAGRQDKQARAPSRCRRQSWKLVGLAGSAGSVGPGHGLAQRTCGGNASGWPVGWARRVQIRVRRSGAGAPKDPSLSWVGQRHIGLEGRDDSLSVKLRVEGWKTRHGESGSINCTRGLLVI